MMIKQRSGVRNPGMLVSAFALAVTCEGRKPKDWVARKGKYSLQRALERIIPEIILSESEKRFRTKSKIATAAFLKVLENKCGFKRIRIRRQGLDSDAGDLLFCSRRWLRPSDPSDRELLQRNYQTLCFAFPAFSRCPLAAFLDIIGEFSTAWGSVLNKIRSRGPDAKLCGGADPVPAPVPCRVLRSTAVEHKPRCPSPPAGPLSSPRSPSAATRPASPPASPSAAQPDDARTLRPSSSATDVTTVSFLCNDEAAAAATPARSELAPIAAAPADDSAAATTAKAPAAKETARQSPPPAAPAPRPLAASGSAMDLCNLLNPDDPMDLDPAAAAAAPIKLGRDAAAASASSCSSSSSSAPSSSAAAAAAAAAAFPFPRFPPVALPDFSKPSRPPTPRPAVAASSSAAAATAPPRPPSPFARLLAAASQPAGCRPASPFQFPHPAAIAAAGAAAASPRASWAWGAGACAR